MKFRTAQGKLRLEVSSTKCIGACGKKGIHLPPEILVIFIKKCPPPAICNFEGKTKLFLAYFL